MITPPISSPTDLMLWPSSANIHESRSRARAYFRRAVIPLQSFADWNKVSLLGRGNRKMLGDVFNSLRPIVTQQNYLPVEHSVDDRDVVLSSEYLVLDKDDNFPRPSARTP